MRRLLGFRQFQATALALSLLASAASADIRITRGGSEWVTIEGTYVRHSGQIIGEFDSNGWVRSSTGEILGEIDSSGWIRSSTRQILGQVSDDGALSIEGGEVARVESDGTIKVAGKHWGKASPCCNEDDHRRVIMALYFLDSGGFPAAPSDRSRNSGEAGAGSSAEGAGVFGTLLRVLTALALLGAGLALSGAVVRDRVPPLSGIVRIAEEQGRAIGVTCLAVGGLIALRQLLSFSLLADLLPLLACLSAGLLLLGGTSASLSEGETDPGPAKDAGGLGAYLGSLAPYRDSIGFVCLALSFLHLAFGSSTLL